MNNKNNTRTNLTNNLVLNSLLIINKIKFVLQSNIAKVNKNYLFAFIAFLFFCYANYLLLQQFIELTYKINSLIANVNALELAVQQKNTTILELENSINKINTLNTSLQEQLVINELELAKKDPVTIALIGAAVFMLVAVFVDVFWR